MSSNTCVKRIIKANDKESSRVPWLGGHVLQECVCNQELSVCPVIKLLESKGYKRDMLCTRQFILPDVKLQYINFDIPNFSSIWLRNDIHNAIKNCKQK